MKRIYDSSALVNIILNKGSKALFVLSGHVTLDLATYEIGNSVWKMSCLRKDITKDEARNLLDVCVKTMSKMKIVTACGIEKDISKMAFDTKCSYYDSAYLTIAQKHRLELITDDMSLQKIAAKCGIRVSDSELDPAN